MTDMNDLQLSLFRGVHDTQPRPITLMELVTMMRTDQSVRDLTDKHRYARTTGDEQGAKRYKHMMASFGVAARFEGGRQQKHIVEYTGLSLVDIDHIAEEDMARVLDLVRADEHTLLAYTTLSGKGLRVLFRYELEGYNGYPLRFVSQSSTPLVPLKEGQCSLVCSITDNAEYAEYEANQKELSPFKGDERSLIKWSEAEGVKQYKQAFAEGNKYYEDLVSLPTDGQCKNTNRISTIAYDENLYYNPEAVPFTVKLEEKKPVGRPKKVKSEEGKVKSICSLTPKLISGVLAKVEAQGIRYEEGTYNKYVSTACYEMNRHGVPEKECREWAAKWFADYATPDVEAIVHSCYQQIDDHGDYLKSKRGRKKSESSVGDVRDIRDYLTSHEVKTRYNVITRKYEIYNEDTDTWCEKTDRMESTLYCRITEEIGKRILKSDLHQLLGSEFSPEYNPFVDYLTSLTPIPDDDDTDYIDLVASMVHVATADEAKHRRWFKKWFVAMIACWLDPEVTNHVILAYIGRQGIYKSTFMRRLLPPVLSSYFSVRNYASRMDKDDRLMLAEKGLVALEEIDSLTPRELNQLKAIVTAETIDERDAYSANRESRVHIASFCATGNNRRFLTDLTGNRRWLPFYVTDIDSPYTHAIPHERLYAQAYALYREGFRYWFEADEVAELDAHNANFEEPNMVQELIETYLRQPYDGEAGQFYTSANILTAITAYCGGRVSIRPREIYMWMNRLGYVQCRVGNLRGWNVIVLTGNDIHDNHRLNAHRSRPDEE